MAVFGAIFFSTVRIRESCVDCISRMAGDKKRQKNRKAYHIIQDHAVCPSCCRTCGGQQLKHGGDYSWHCRDPDLYRQSEICPVHMDGGDRDWIHGYLSWTGELPFGAYRHLAESGEI